MDDKFITIKRGTKDIKNFLSDKPIKITMIDVMCFSMSGDYVCPYYGVFNEESQKHCNDCWNPTK